MSAEVLSYFGFNCPNGGNFYICENGTQGEFVGCCDSDACGNGGICPDGDLRTASFNPSKYDELLNQDCHSGSETENKWWTCTGSTPPYMGCCTENPCDTSVNPNGGCSQSNLRPAFLAPEQYEARRTPLLQAPGSKQTGTPSAKESSTPTSVELEVKSGGDSGLSTGAIVGIVIGCCAVIVILVAIIFFMCGRRSRKRKSKAQSAPEQQPAMDYINQYGGEYGSPYTDSYGGSTAAGGRYSQDSYAKKPLSTPGTPSFPQTYADDSSDYSAAGHPSHRRYHSGGGQPQHGLGLSAVQELDSNMVAGFPSELDGASGTPYYQQANTVQELAAGDSNKTPAAATTLQPPPKAATPPIRGSSPTGQRYDGSINRGAWPEAAQAAMSPESMAGPRSHAAGYGARSVPVSAVESPLMGHGRSDSGEGEWSSLARTQYQQTQQQQQTARRRELRRVQGRTLGASRTDDESADDGDLRHGSPRPTVMGQPF